MKVPSFISEELQQDLNQYNSSLSCESIEFNSVCEIKDEEEKKQILEDMKTIIIPHFQNDQVVIILSQDQNKLIFLTSKLNSSSPAPTSEICQKIKNLILNKTPYRLLIDSNENIQNLIEKNAEINTLIMSSCKVKEIGDKTIVQLVLYTDAEKKEVNKERVAKVFGNRMLATEIFEIDQRKVEEEQIKYLKKFLKKKEIKDELLNDFEVTDISIHKKGKRKNLMIEICSSRFKEFIKNKSKDLLTLNNFYEKFKEHLQTKNNSSEFELDDVQIEAFARFPKPLDDIKRSCPDSTFTFEFTKKSKELFKNKSDFSYLDNFYEKVAKVRLPYTIPDNFKFPCLMIYNALLTMINSGEDELETLYGDKEVKFLKIHDVLSIAFEDKKFNLQSRPVSKVIASLKLIIKTCQ